MKRTRPCGATGGSMARIVMIAGTASIEVLCRVPISSQKPRRLNSVHDQARPRGQGREQPTTSALMWNRGRQQYRGRPGSAGGGGDGGRPRASADPRGAGCPWASPWSRSCTGRSPRATRGGRREGALSDSRPVSRRLPPVLGQTEDEARLRVIADHRHRLRHLQHPRHVAAGAPGSSGTATRPAARMPTRAPA